MTHYTVFAVYAVVVGFIAAEMFAVGPISYCIWFIFTWIIFPIRLFYDLWLWMLENWHAEN